MRCHIVKNTLLHIAFSAILPAGKVVITLLWHREPAGEHLINDTDIFVTLNWQAVNHFRLNVERFFAVECLLPIAF